MSDLQQNQNPQPPADEAAVHPEPRASWGRLGRFAAITPPAVTLLLSVMSKPAAVAVSPAPESSRQFKEPVTIPQLRKVA